MGWNWQLGRGGGAPGYPWRVLGLTLLLCQAALPAAQAGRVHGSNGVNGVSPTEIILGQSAPFSGPAGELGRDFQEGAQSYFAQVNARGGVHGRRVRLLSLDDRYEPERAAANTQQLIWRDKVFAHE